MPTCGMLKPRCHPRPPGDVAVDITALLMATCYGRRVPTMSGDTCPDCGSKFYHDGRCIACAQRRMLEQRRQMSERSGPQYDLAVSRGRAGAAAWRAAGSPAKVSLAHIGSIDADGNHHSEAKWLFSAALKRGQIVEATPEQVDAWYAWRNSRP